MCYKLLQYTWLLCVYMCVYKNKKLMNVQRRQSEEARRKRKYYFILVSHEMALEIVRLCVSHLSFIALLQQFRHTHVNASAFKRVYLCY